MYESQTYSAILQRMLDRVPSNIDKREGSVIYDALAPAAVELAQMYIELDVNLNLSSGLTATGKYLDLRTKDYGITRKPATKAILKGVFYNEANNAFDVPIGSRFSASELNFLVTGKLAIGQFTLECETPGSIGSSASGDLLPINFIAGLAYASISQSLVPGTDEESDKGLRERYLDRVRTPSSSGNKADYRKWALELEGVGDAQIVPLWNGKGTVKVVILDANKVPASSVLVNEVQAYISPYPGTGEGRAPVGATVTVAAATGVSINISATITLDGSRTLMQIKADFEASLIEYLKNLAFSSDASVKYVRVGSLLLDTQGVQDYASLMVNSGTSNITIGVGSVAIKGTVTLT